jgi:hypothetical protein
MKKRILELNGDIPLRERFEIMELSDNSIQEDDLILSDSRSFGYISANCGRLATMFTNYADAGAFSKCAVFLESMIMYSVN